MHMAGLTAHQRVPARQWLAKCRQAIAAAMRQPVQLHHILGRDFGAIGHVLLAVGVIAALVGVETEIAARHVGKRNFARVLILYPNLTAKAAAIAKGFPLGIGHLTKRLLQKIGLRFARLCHARSSSTRRPKRKPSFVQREITWLWIGAYFFPLAKNAPRLCQVTRRKADVCTRWLMV